MSADLYIHSCGFPDNPDVTGEDLACFFSSTLGSERFVTRPSCPDDPFCTHWDRVKASPSVWIGQVSWLKAGLYDDDSFIPEPVEAVHDLIGENLPVLDDELRDKILSAMRIPGKRAPHYRVTRADRVREWLDAHMGQRLFTVSW